MKIFFSIVLVLSLLTEVMAAVSLIAGPGGIQEPGLGNQWTMHYGFAAFAIASLSIWTWPYRSELPAVTLALGVLMTFHTGLAISLTVAGDQQAGMVIHSVLAVLSIVLFTQRRRWCESKELINE